MLLPESGTELGMCRKKIFERVFRTSLDTPCWFRSSSNASTPSPLSWKHELKTRFFSHGTYSRLFSRSSILLAVVSKERERRSDKIKSTWMIITTATTSDESTTNQSPNWWELVKHSRNPIFSIVLTLKLEINQLNSNQQISIISGENYHLSILY